jgi:hypothetical protein
VALAEANNLNPIISFVIFINTTMILFNSTILFNQNPPPAFLMDEWMMSG